MGAAKKALKAQRAEQQKLEGLLASRQQVIDPYAGVTDLSAMISNPFQNLQVATQAAEMQATEADLSLAGTLDTLRASGMGAGGATALAQAAARSKQGIAASIEQQEAQISQLRAQGEAQAQQMRMAEAQRMQEAGILGQTFMFQAQEQRDVADISRAAAQAQQYGQQYYDIKAANKAMIGDIVQGVGSIAGGLLSERRLKKNIKLIGKSKSGLNIYLFEYINKAFGEGVYQGIMVDEAPSYAVVNIGNYKGVDYSKIDVEFKRIK